MVVTCEPTCQSKPWRRLKPWRRFIKKTLALFLVQIALLGGLSAMQEQGARGAQPDATILTPEETALVAELLKLDSDKLALRLLSLSPEIDREKILQNLVLAQATKLKQLEDATRVRFWRILYSIFAFQQIASLLNNGGGYLSGVGRILQFASNMLPSLNLGRRWYLTNSVAIGLLLTQFLMNYAFQDATDNSLSEEALRDLYNLCQTYFVANGTFV